jgi:hypothetical protein
MNMRRCNSDQRNKQQPAMQDALLRGFQKCGRKMRVNVTQKQTGLKKQQTTGPHIWSTAQFGKQQFPNHRLDQEHQSCTCSEQAEQMQLGV